ncbi:MAG TPA: hypothetical protein VF547_04965, partial [Allosphingosinicella sp.]
TSFLDDVLGRTSIAGVGLRSISTRAGDQQIGVAYDFDNNRLVLADVDGAGGGSIRLTGKIYSTTTYGALQVNSGYGDIQIRNESTAALRIGDIYTGTNSLGTIQITDLNKTGHQGSPLTTWFVYETAGNRLTTYDNAATGSLNYTTLAPRSVIDGRTTSYAPEAGYRYNWQMSRSASRFVLPNSVPDEFAVYRNSTSDWQWTSSDWQIGGQSFDKAPRTGMPFFEQTVSGKITDRNRTRDGYGNFAFSTTDGAFVWGNVQHTKYVEAVTGIEITNKMSVKADNPIAIGFTGNANARVDIQSKGDIAVAGRIGNSTGTASIVGTGAATGIVDAQGMIVTRDLTLGASGSGYVGTADKPLHVSASGTIAANAPGGVALAVDGTATLGQVSATGDVQIAATGAILGKDGTASVSGRNISLAAAGGAIEGAGGAPLTIQTQTTQLQDRILGGELTASARDSINLRQPTGDLRLRHVTSQTGDVTLEASTGSIRNAVTQFTVDEDNLKRLADVWSELGLTDPQSVLKAVTAFERFVATQQAERARILAQVEMVDGKVVGLGKPGASADEIALVTAIYGGQLKARDKLAADPTADQIKQYIQQRFDAIEAYARETFGADRPAGFDSADPTQAFAYLLDPASPRYRELTRGVWTETQLTQSLSEAALTPVSNTQILLQEPNVKGRSVTLVAAQGSIGQNLEQLVIDAQVGRLLTPAERAALAAAGPGDVRVEASAGGGHQLTVSQQRLVNVAATGDVTARAATDLYLGSNGNLRAAAIETAGTARIAISGSISDVAGAQRAAVTAGDLLIEAGNGSIGTSAAPLRVQLSGRLLSARAGIDVHIKQLQGDLRTGVAFAGGLLSLEAGSGSILSAFANNEAVRLQGDSIALAATGDLGTAANRLQVEVASTGTLSGSGRAAVIHSPEGLLRVGALSLSGAATISGADLAFVGAFDGASLVARAPNGDLDVTGSVATSGNAALIAGNVRLGDGATVTSGGNLSVEAGDARFGELASATVGGTSRIAARSGLEFAAGARLSSTGAADLTAGTAIQLGDSAAIASSGDALGLGAASLAAGDGVSLSAATVLQVQTGTGALVFGKESRLSGGSVALSSAGALALGDGSRANGAAGVALLAGNGAALGDRVALTGSAGDVTVTTTAGDLVIGEDAALNGSRV